MLWVLKRAVSMRQFFWAPKTYVKIDGKENIYNFTLKFFVLLSKPVKIHFVPVGKILGQSQWSVYLASKIYLS